MFTVTPMKRAAGNARHVGRALRIVTALLCLLLWSTAAMADEPKVVFEPFEFKQTVDKHQGMMQQAINTCDEEMYDKARADIERAFTLHREELDTEIAAIRNRHDIPSSVDTSQEANELLETEKARQQGKGMAQDASPAYLKDLEDLAVLLQSRQDLDAIEERTIYPKYPDPCGEPEPAMAAPKAEPEPMMEPKAEPETVAPTPMTEKPMAEEPAAAAPMEKKPMVEPKAPAPKAEKKAAPTPRTQSQPSMAAPRTPTTPSMVQRTPTAAAPRFAIDLEAGLVNMDVPPSGYGTKNVGGDESFAGESSSLLTGYTLGGTLKFFLEDMFGAGPRISEPPVVAEPSLNLGFYYTQAEDDADTMIAPGGPVTAVTFPEDFAGLTGLVLGPVGLDVETKADYLQYDLELSLSHPCFQTDTGLGLFTFFGTLGAGHSWSSYDLEALAMIPGLAGQQSKWVQEVDQERTYGIVGVKFVLQPVDKVAVSLGGNLKPGYKTADLDSNYRQVAPLLAPPLDNFSLDSDDSLHGWDWTADVGADIALALTDNLSLSLGVIYEYIDEFAYPDNRENPGDDSPELDTDSADVLIGVLRTEFTF